MCWCHALGVTQERTQSEDHAAEIATLTTDRDEWQEVSRDWRYRAEAAEKEAREQRAEVATLSAEVARLRAEYVPITNQMYAAVLERDAANALLNEWLQHHGSDPRGPGPATMAHLAGGPTAAAPARAAAEQRVLDACAAMSLCDDDPDVDPSEPQEAGEDCYIYTNDQYVIAKAELKRRAVTK
jgi:hypothetical protein